MEEADRTIYTAALLVITFSYLVFMSISQAFGKNGVMSPILTAWFANTVFFVAAMVNIARAQK